MLKEHTEEENIVIFNALKKIINEAYSSLSIQGISSQELGLSTNCLLLKYKDKFFFLSNPKLSIENSKLKLYCFKRCYVFNKKQSIEILNYLYCTNYIDLFSEEGFQLQNETFV